MVADVWAVAEAYEPYVGRWSRQVATAFVRWLAVFPGSRWVDVGCGTGAVSSAILATGEPASVVGIDPSAGFVAYAQDQIDTPRASFAVGDARALPLREGAVQVVASGLMLNFVPEPDGRHRGDDPGHHRDGRRVRLGLRRGHAVHAGVLGRGRRPRPGRAGRGPALPAVHARRGCARRSPRPGWSTSRSRQSSCRRRSATSTTSGSRSWAVRAPRRRTLMSLPEEHREALRQRLYAELGDGPIDLTARAWAVRGYR